MTPFLKVIVLEKLIQLVVSLVIHLHKREHMTNDRRLVDMVISFLNGFVPFIFLENRFEKGMSIRCAASSRVTEDRRRNAVGASFIMRFKPLMLSENPGILLVFLRTDRNMDSEKKMSMENGYNFPDDFLELSRTIGEDWFLCQHQGGNTSFKYSSGLTIKASGKSLSESESDPLNTFISDADGSIPEMKKRFSIETPLHRALMHKYVFHLHPVDILLLSCISKLDDLHKRLTASLEMPVSIQVIPYADPGIELANELISRQLDSSCHTLLILESHGIVIASDSVTVARDMVNSVRQASSSFVHSCIPRFKDIEEIARRLLSVYPGLAFELSVTELGINEMTLKWLLTQDSYLYPDHGVFYNSLDKLFSEDILVSRPDRIGLKLFAGKLTVKLPEVSTRSHREHAILIFTIILSLSKLSGCSFSLLPSAHLDLLVSSDAEQFRLANA